MAAKFAQDARCRARPLTARFAAKAANLRMGDQRGRHVIAVHIRRELRRAVGFGNGIRTRRVRPHARPFYVHMDCRNVVRSSGQHLCAGAFRTKPVPDLSAGPQAGSPALF